MNLKFEILLLFIKFYSEQRIDKKNFCQSSTFRAPGLLSGTGETYRLSVMCQLDLGFCNLKKLFESNVLFFFCWVVLAYFVIIYPFTSVVYGTFWVNYILFFVLTDKKFCRFFTCNFCSMVDIGSILIFFSLSCVLLFTIFFSFSV